MTRDDILKAASGPQPELIDIPEIVDRRRRHGHTSGQHPKGTPTYKAWQVMRQRCNNPRHDKYHRYGGAGIRVCNRWDRSFSAFLNDMGEKPSRRHTLDRID